MVLAERRREDSDHAADRQTHSLAALAFLLLLVVGGLHLVRVLHQAAVVQDCALSGRAGCLALAAAALR